MNKLFDLIENNLDEKPDFIRWRAVPSGKEESLCNGFI